MRVALIFLAALYCVCAQNPTSCPDPDPLDHTVHLAHPDCTKYYRCDHGEPVEDNCPGGLHFNPSLQVCDWPDQAGCEAAVTSDPDPEPTADPDPEPTADPQPEPTDPPAPEDPSICTDHNALLPHATDCSKFYICDNGDAKEMNCPDGLYFNASLEVCDWPDQAGCTQGGGAGGTDNGF